MRFTISFVAAIFACQAGIISAAPAQTIPALIYDHDRMRDECSKGALGICPPPLNARSSKPKDPPVYLPPWLDYNVTKSQFPQLPKTLPTGSTPEQQDIYLKLKAQVLAAREKFLLKKEGVLEAGTKAFKQQFTAWEIQQRKQDVALHRERIANKHASKVSLLAAKLLAAVRKICAEKPKKLSPPS